jgi:hypothetical protein
MSENVVHCKRDKYDVYIGRPGKWGNPIPLKDNADEKERYAVICEYVAWLNQQPGLVDQARQELKGKVLGCWCAPKLCHGNILTLVAEGFAPSQALRQVSSLPE